MQTNEYSDRDVPTLQFFLTKKPSQLTQNVSSRYRNSSLAHRRNPIRKRCGRRLGGKEQSDIGKVFAAPRRRRRRQRKKTQNRRFSDGAKAAADVRKTRIDCIRTNVPRNNGTRVRVCAPNRFCDKRRRGHGEKTSQGPRCQAGGRRTMAVSAVCTCGAELACLRSRAAKETSLDTAGRRRRRRGLWKRAPS